MVVNHPFGILEGAVLATLLSRIRRDVKFLANGVLTAIPEIRDLIIPVDPTAGSSVVRSNGGGLRQALNFLAAVGCWWFPPEKCRTFSGKSCQLWIHHGTRQ